MLGGASVWKIPVSSLSRIFKQEILFDPEPARCCREAKVYATDVFPVTEKAKWLNLYLNS